MIPQAELGDSVIQYTRLVRIIEHCEIRLVVSSTVVKVLLLLCLATIRNKEDSMDDPTFNVSSQLFFRFFFDQGKVRFVGRRNELSCHRAYISFRTSFVVTNEW